LVVLNLTCFFLEPPNKLLNQLFFSSSTGAAVLAGALAGAGALSGSGELAGVGAGALAGALSSILRTELSSATSPSPPRCFLLCFFDLYDLTIIYYISIIIFIEIYDYRNI
jgi:hypothetical protein